jgi:hypothetical protein
VTDRCELNMAASYLRNPAAVPVTVSPALARLRDDLQDRLRRHGAV